MTIDQNVIDRVEELKHNTSTNILAIQNDCTPGILNINLEPMTFFIFRGVKIPIRFPNIQIYMSKDIPYIPSILKSESFIDFMYPAVLSQKVIPFLLFIDNKMVNWSNILIIKDYNYCYLMILNNPDIIREAKMVYIPTKVRYGEDEDIDTSLNGLYFDDNGLCTTTYSDAVTRLELLLPEEISMYVYTPTTENPFFEIPLKKGQISSINNIVPFKDGKLYIKALEYLHDEGYNIYKVSAELNLVTYYVFYYNPSNINKSYLFKGDNEETIKSIIIDSIKNNRNIPDHIESIRHSKFDFSFNKNTSYESNIINTINYIKEYDSSLMNPVYINKSTIFSVSYTGANFMAKVSIDNYIHLSRHQYGTLDNCVMVFINGLLYRYHDNIIYEGNDIKIPNVGININDNIEIVYFARVNNDIVDITIQDQNIDKYISYNYNVHEIMLFSSEAESLEFRILEQDKNTLFEVPFYVNKTTDDKYNFILEDPFYYNKKLYMASTRQFRHTTFRYRLNSYKFVLPDSFKFCHDIDRYFVFVNGAKINKDFYTIAIPKTTRPFDHVILWISTFMLDEDIIDVFYLPDNIVEIVKFDELDRSGDIVVQLPDKCHPLSKDLYLFFVNGKKVPSNWIVDLSINKVHIKTDINVIHEVSIMKYIDTYYDYLHIVDKTSAITALDEYSTKINNMGINVKDIYKNMINTISIGKDYREDYYTLRNLVYEIVYEYYLCRAGIDYTEKFIYDFEDVFDTSKDGTVIIPFFNGEDNDKMVMHRLNTLADWQYAAISYITTWSNEAFEESSKLNNLNDTTIDISDPSLIKTNIIHVDNWETSTYGYGNAGYINVFIDEDDNLWYEVSYDSDIKNIYIDPKNGNLVFEYIKKDIK